MTQARRILIVEDHADIAELLKLRLGLAGYETDVAANAEAAAQALKGFRPDGILLDIGLPGQDGFAFLKSIKSNPEFKTIPVLMLTARQAMGDIQIALRLGASDYVAKPFDDRKLLFRIGRMLGDQVATPSQAQRTYVWNK